MYIHTVDTPAFGISVNYNVFDTHTLGHNVKSYAFDTHVKKKRMFSQSPNTSQPAATTGTWIQFSIISQTETTLPHIPILGEQSPPCF